MKIPAIICCLFAVALASCAKKQNNLVKLKHHLYRREPRSLDEVCQFCQRLKTTLGVSKNSQNTGKEVGGARRVRRNYSGCLAASKYEKCDICNFVY